MDGRSLNRQERDKVHAAHANYFQQQQKRKHSTKNDQVNSPTIAKFQTENTTQGQSGPSNTTITQLDMSAKRFKFPGTTSTAPAKTASKASLIVRFYDPDVQARDAHSRTQEEILTWPDYQLERCHNYIQMLFPVPEGSAFNWEAPIIDRETMDAFRSRSELQQRLRASFNRMLNFYGFEMKAQSKQGEAKKENVLIGNDTEAGATEQKSEGVDSSSSDPNPTSEANCNADTEEAVEGKGEDLEAQDTTKASFPSGTHSNSTPTFNYHIVRNSHWSKSFNSWAVRFDHNHLRITRILRCLRILGLQTECDAFYAALKEVYEDPKFNISDRSMSYWTRAVTRPLYIAPDDECIEWLQVWEQEQDALKASKKKAEDEGKVSEGEKKDSEE